MRVNRDNYRKNVFLQVFLFCSFGLFFTGRFLAAAGDGTISSQKEASDAEYRFVPGDTVELKFFYNPDMNETVQIRPDGKIAMPLIEEVDLKGKTVAEASRMLEALYAPHLKTPKITIQIRNYAAQKVYVGGEVLRPGVLPLTAQMTLFDAIMEAGGRKHTASTDFILLIRKTPAGTAEIRSIPLKGKEARIDEQPMALLLKPCDAVFLPESRIARLDRWVDQYIRQVVPFSMAVDFSYIMNSRIYTK